MENSTMAQGTATQRDETGDETGNPIHHTRKMSAQLEEIRDHLREDIKLVNEPQFKAMFETAAEVLGGLVTAFRHYEAKNESAWKQ
jgi:hypothetical protein